MDRWSASDVLMGIGIGLPFCLAMWGALIMGAIEAVRHLRGKR